tara:strand:- start:82 stop:588 length:507 start_codon:yes stop_codon:yes gene_type:complete
MKYTLRIIVLMLVFGGFIFKMNSFSQNIKSKPEKSNEISVKLNGVYQYVYEHNTEDLVENHYLEFKDSEIIYYGTSDDFDQAREGYYPGFFSKKAESVEITRDSLKFQIKIRNADFYERPITPFIKDENNPLWSIGVTEKERIYKGVFKNDKILIYTKGFETRTFEKK